MPAAPKSHAGRSRIRTTRARTGCLTCRTRRVKCDEQKPCCLRCTRYGAECIYPPQLTLDQVAARTTSSNVSNEALGAVDRPNEEIRCDRSILRPIDDDRTVETLGAGPPPRSSAEEQDDSSRNPFQKPCIGQNQEQGIGNGEYCILYVLPALPKRGNTNPWITHVIPLVDGQEGGNFIIQSALRHAIEALGATSASNSRDAGPLEKEMKQDQADFHRGQALEGLFIVWKVRSSEIQVQEDWEMFFAAGVLLILHDAQRGSQDWRLVWTMMGYAVRLRRKLYKDEETGHLIRYLLGLLRVLDCLACAVVGVRPIDHTTWGLREQLSCASPLPIDLRLLDIMADSITCLSEKIKLDQELGPVDLSPYEAIALGNESTEHRLFGDTSCRIRRRALGIQLKAINKRRTEWLADREYLEGLEEDVRRRSLVLCQAIWLQILSDVYLEDMEKEDVQLLALKVLEDCEVVGTDCLFLSWPLMVAASVLYRETDRQQALSVIERSYPAHLSTIIRKIWGFADLTGQRSLRQNLLEMGQVVSLV